MALGNVDLTNFQPKASKTAESLLTFVPPQAQKKEVTIQLRITDDKRQLFKETCASCNVEMSDALRAFIDSVIAKGRL